MEAVVIVEKQDQSKIYYFEDTQLWETDFKNLKTHYLIYNYVSNSEEEVLFNLLGCAHAGKNTNPCY